MSEVETRLNAIEISQLAAIKEYSAIGKGRLKDLRLIFCQPYTHRLLLEAGLMSDRYMLVDIAANARALTSEVLEEVYFLRTQNDTTVDLIKEQECKIKLLNSKYATVKMFQDVINRISYYYHNNSGLIHTVVNHKNCPSSILLELINPKHELYRHTVRYALKHPNLPVAVMRKKFTPRFIPYIEKNPKCPSDLLELAFSSNDVHRIQRALINPNCPPHRMATTNILLIIENPACPEARLKQAWLERPAIREKIINNPNCPPDLLLEQLLRTRLPGIIRHPRANAKILAFGAMQPDLAVFALEHPNAPHYLFTFAKV